MSKNKQETQNKQKRLELTNDYVFKRIFAKPKNNQELKEFVEAILDIKIKKIEVKNPELTKNYSDEKLGVLDIRATEDLTDRVEFHYIELKKFIKSKPGMNSKLEQWLWLLTGEDEKIKMASKENKTIEKVLEDLDEMSADENERLEAYKRKLEIIDYNTTMAQAEEKGEMKKQREIAKKMKEKGIEVETIIEITGLTKKEIEDL